jgi:hypothetical protein
VCSASGQPRGTISWDLYWLSSLVAITCMSSQVAGGSFMPIPWRYCVYHMKPMASTL